MYYTFVRCGCQSLFDTAMLVSEKYLQMKNIFTVALEPEMSRLYHACVHGAYGNFMNFSSADFQMSRDICSIGIIRTGRAWMVNTYRFKPWMPQGPYSVLFIYFPFEQMYLRYLRC
jgi:hypothetical protein